MAKDDGLGQFITKRNGFHYLGDKRLWDMTKQELMDAVVRFDAEIAMYRSIEEHRLCYRFKQFMKNLVQTWRYKWHILTRMDSNNFDGSW